MYFLKTEGKPLIDAVSLITLPQLVFICYICNIALRSCKQTSGRMCHFFLTVLKKFRFLLRDTVLKNREHKSVTKPVSFILPTFWFSQSSWRGWERLSLLTSFLPPTWVDTSWREICVPSMKWSTNTCPRWSRFVGNFSFCPGRIYLKYLSKFSIVANFVGSHKKVKAHTYPYQGDDDIMHCPEYRTTFRFKLRFSEFHNKSSDQVK